MSEDIAVTLNKLNEDRFNSSEQREVIALSEHTWSRFILHECVTHIYTIKGREERLCFVADEGSLPRLRERVDQALLQIIPPRPPIERVCRQLFREVRNNRKPKQPQKRNWKKDSFNYAFKAKSRIAMPKIRRGYLNVARANVIRTMRTDKTSFQEIQTVFYEKAQELLNDMRRLRHYIQSKNEMYSVEEVYGCLSV